MVKVDLAVSIQHEAGVFLLVLAFLEGGVAFHHLNVGLGAWEGCALFFRILIGFLSTVLLRRIITQTHFSFFFLL